MNEDWALFPVVANAGTHMPARVRHERHPTDSMMHNNACTDVWVVWNKMLIDSMHEMECAQTQKHAKITIAV